MQDALQAALRSRRRHHDVRGFTVARERTVPELEALVAARTAEVDAGAAQPREEMATRAHG